MKAAAGQTGGLAWLKRLFSHTSAPALPLAVLELLQSAPVQVQKVPGQGRGLFATRDLEYGTVLFAEQPFLCVPAISKRKHVCYHCLKVLPGAQQAMASADAQPGTVFTRGHAFCSPQCQAAAHSSFYLLESQLRANMGQLDSYCEAHGERFPLLAARLAMMVAQRAMLQQAGDMAADAAAAMGGGCGGIARFSSSSSSSLNKSSYQLGTTSNRSSSSSNSSRQSRGIGRLSLASVGSQSTAHGAKDNPIGDLSFLCYANVPLPPPAPWQAAHKLLMAPLQAACSCREEPGEGEALAAALEHLDILWYTNVLARLHINSFKVEGVLPLDLSYAAAAAMLGEDGSTGSAVYLLASLFNHSCEPCVNVGFPNNDGTAVFTTARRISAGEQLFISYIDTQQEVDIRQEYLAFAYGFRCACQRCHEELAEAARSAPPQL